MTRDATINRPIKPDELAVISLALERASVAPEFAALATELEHLCVVDRCKCGCDSVDFAKHDPTHPPKPIADAIGTTAAGGTVGVIVWGTPEAVTGLEIYDLGAGDKDLRLPVPNSIRPWESGAA